MKISNNPPQHLSNYEVLQHFLALKEDTGRLQDAVANKALREQWRARKHVPFIKRRRDAPEEPELPELPQLTPKQLKAEDDLARRGVSNDLVWVQDEVIKYLCADYNVTARQTEEGVRSIIDGLQAQGLTKAELLQAVNLAPRSHVGLYLVIEEAETRLPQPYEDTMNRMIGDIIQASLLDEPPEELQPFLNTVQATEIAQNIMDEGMFEEDMYAEEEEFVHEAEWGAGKEAAADDEEDNTMD